jgi:MFS transporter, DHA1 family, multidrug resistance protein
VKSPFRARTGSLRLEPWQRNLYTIVIAETVAMLGFGIAQPFLPFYLQDMGVHSVDRVAFWVGLISSFQPIAMAVSAPLWGLLADRVGRKPMLVRAMVGGGVALILSGLAQSPAQLASFRILEGVLAGTVAAATTLVAVSTPREHTGYSLGLLQTAMFTGNFLGPLVGGFIGSTLGYRAAFLIAGSLLALNGLIVTTVVKEIFVRPAPHQRKTNPLLDTLRMVVRHPVVSTMVMLLVLNNMSVTVTLPVLPLYVQSIVPDLKQAAAVTGGILGVTALANAVAAIWVGRSADRIGRRRILIACVILGALSYLPQGLTRYAWQLLVLRIVTGFAMGGISPVTNAIIAEAAAEGTQGGVYGVSASLNAMGRAMGPVIGAFVVTSAGVPAVFAVTGLMLLVVSALLSLRLRSVDISGRKPAAAGAGEPVQETKR